MVKSDGKPRLMNAALYTCVFTVAHASPVVLPMQRASRVTPQAASERPPHVSHAVARP